MRRNFGIAAATAAAILFSFFARAADSPKPGLPEIQAPFSDLKPTALLKLGETADWVEIADGAVWVGAGKSVHAIDPVSEKEIAAVPLPGEACAGLSAAVGLLWVPLCQANGVHALAEINLATRTVVRVLPFGPEEEGGVAASDSSIWITEGKSGVLLQVDPANGKIRQRIKLPPQAWNPLLAEGNLWITDSGNNRVIRFDARSGPLLGSTPTGPAPHFLTSGAGSIWSLNQGDGSVSRIDGKTGRMQATIPLGLPGHGGDIAYGDGKIWVTMAGVPLTAIDPATNKPLRQWVGPGGDSLKVEAGKIWLTDYHGGTIAAIPDPLR